MQALPNSGSMPAGYGQPAPALPILTLENSDIGEFDYSAFLQDQQDIDYLAEDSSESLTTPASSTSPPSGTFSDGSFQVVAPQRQQQALAPSGALTVPSIGYGIRNPGSSSSSSGSGGEGQTQAQRRKLERRGHTKSRRGCFNCKRRRIKCQETRPACGHCVKQGLKCEYPSLPTIVHQPQHQVPLFSLQDMRFFQHFLLHCYPHHPIGSEHLWTHEIPCLSERYEYLMHAILGYSASELMVTVDPSLAEAAMTHRLKAIKAIKKALSASTTTTSTSPTSPSSGPAGNHGDTMFEEGNALMATCIALTYQSVLLEDGMAEYMTFIRGIMIVAAQMYVRGAQLLFGHLLGDRQKEALAPHMKKLGLIDQRWVDRAVAAVEGLRGLVVGVEGREVERRYWELIGEMAGRLRVNSWEAYLALTDHYTWWMMLPHDKFQRLVDPTNQVALLLGAHWIALEQIMAPICETEYKAAAKTLEKPKEQPQPSGGTGAGAGAGVSLGNIGWLRYLNGQVDLQHLAYNQWPMWVEEQLLRDRTFFGKTL